MLTRQQDQQQQKQQLQQQQQHFLHSNNVTEIKSKSIQNNNQTYTNHLYSPETQLLLKCLPAKCSHQPIFGQLSISFKQLILNTSPSKGKHVMYRCRMLGYSQAQSPFISQNITYTIHTNIRMFKYYLKDMNVCVIELLDRRNCEPIGHCYLGWLGYMKSLLAQEKQEQSKEKAKDNLYSSSLSMRQQQQSSSSLLPSSSQNNRFYFPFLDQKCQATLPVFDHGKVKIKKGLNKLNNNIDVSQGDCGIVMNTQTRSNQRCIGQVYIQFKSRIYEVAISKGYNDFNYKNNKEKPQLKQLITKQKTKKQLFDQISNKQQKQSQLKEVEENNFIINNHSNHSYNKKQQNNNNVQTHLHLQKSFQNHIIKDNKVVVNNKNNPNNNNNNNNQNNNYKKQLELELLQPSSSPSLQLISKDIYNNYKNVNIISPNYKNNELQLINLKYDALQMFGTQDWIQRKNKQTKHMEQQQNDTKLATAIIKNPTTATTTNSSSLNCCCIIVIKDIQQVGIVVEDGATSFRYNLYLKNLKLNHYNQNKNEKLSRFQQKTLRNNQSQHQKQTQTVNPSSSLSSLSSYTICQCSSVPNVFAIQMKSNKNIQINHNLNKNFNKQQNKQQQHEQPNLINIKEQIIGKSKNFTLINVGNDKNLNYNKNKINKDSIPTKTNDNKNLANYVIIQNLMPTLIFSQYVNIDVNGVNNNKNNNFITNNSPTVSAAVVNNNKNANRSYNNSNSKKYLQKDNSNPNHNHNHNHNHNINSIHTLPIKQITFNLQIYVANMKQLSYFIDQQKRKQAQVYERKAQSKRLQLQKEILQKQLKQTHQQQQQQHYGRDRDHDDQYFKLRQHKQQQQQFVNEQQQQEEIKKNIIKKGNITCSKQTNKKLPSLQQPQQRLATQHIYTTQSSQQQAQNHHHEQQHSIESTSGVDQRQHSISIHHHDQNIQQQQQLNQNEQEQNIYLVEFFCKSLHFVLKCLLRRRKGGKCQKQQQKQQKQQHNVQQNIIQQKINQILQQIVITKNNRTKQQVIQTISLSNLNNDISQNQFEIILHHITKNTTRLKSKQQPHQQQQQQSIHTQHPLHPLHHNKQQQQIQNFNQILIAIFSVNLKNNDNDNVDDVDDDQDSDDNININNDNNHDTTLIKFKQFVLCLTAYYNFLKLLSWNKLLLLKEFDGKVQNIADKLNSAKDMNLSESFFWDKLLAMQEKRKSSEENVGKPSTSTVFVQPQLKAKINKFYRIDSTSPVPIQALTRDITILNEIKSKDINKKQGRNTETQVENTLKNNVFLHAYLNDKNHNNGDVNDDNNDDDSFMRLMSDLGILVRSSIQQVILQMKVSPEMLKQLISKVQAGSHKQQTQEEEGFHLNLTSFQELLKLIGVEISLWESMMVIQEVKAWNMLRSVNSAETGEGVISTELASFWFKNLYARAEIMLKLSKGSGSVPQNQPQPAQQNLPSQYRPSARPSIQNYMIDSNPPSIRKHIEDSRHTSPKKVRIQGSIKDNNSQHNQSDIANIANLLKEHDNNPNNFFSMNSEQDIRKHDYRHVDHNYPHSRPQTQQNILKALDQISRRYQNNNRDQDEQQKKDNQKQSKKQPQNNLLQLQSSVSSLSQTQSNNNKDYINILQKNKKNQQNQEQQKQQKYLQAKIITTTKNQLYINFFIENIKLKNPNNIVNTPGIKKLKISLQQKHKNQDEDEDEVDKNYLQNRSKRNEKHYHQLSSPVVLTSTPTTNLSNKTYFLNQHKVQSLLLTQQCETQTTTYALSNIKIDMNNLYKLETSYKGLTVEISAIYNSKEEGGINNRRNINNCNGQESSSLSLLRNQRIEQRLIHGILPIDDVVGFLSANCKGKVKGKIDKNKDKDKNQNKDKENVKKKVMILYNGKQILGKAVIVMICSTQKSTNFEAGNTQTGVGFIQGNTRNNCSNHNQSHQQSCCHMQFSYEVKQLLSYKSVQPFSSSSSIKCSLSYSNSNNNNLNELQSSVIPGQSYKIKIPSPVIEYCLVLKMYSSVGGLEEKNVDNSQEREITKGNKSFISNHSHLSNKAQQRQIIGECTIPLEECYFRRSIKEQFPVINTDSGQFVSTIGVKLSIQESSQNK